ncbi:SOS response-associated peptidase [Cohnella lubricantis]|uniref:Abasic site processing protein n=1 Tax=Cohnella lubricantis TaxID=2163172 RepID=A0A841TAV5_9BACL|nr:SOS response-associated peptidase [Cohnella lubricantis]MBB6676157.1 SOS response-associated peptidase [Cohnella lubricantis]MBP2118651.1 putative SOS response-associated peptidase YedK [Cohnella lubricantis]
MCQRFSLTAELDELVRQFRIGHVAAPYVRKYNISPTQPVPVIYEYRGQRILDDQRWGLMPYWSKDAVNADYQGIGGRPIFRRIVNKQRCVIPCSGFYGWLNNGKLHQPIRFVFRDRRTFAVPGFYEVWQRAYGEETRAFTMATTAPNRVVEGYADRMPAMLDEEGIDAWLHEGNVEYRTIYHHVRELPADELEMYPVGGYVNDRNKESPECAEPIRIAYAAIRR